MIVIIAALIRCPVMPKSMGNFYHTYINLNIYFNELLFSLLVPAKTTIVRDGNSQRYLRQAHPTRMSMNEI